MLWKRVLLAYVERCRTWKHPGICEHDVLGARAPVSVENRIGALCTCGKGVFPEDFMIDNRLWGLVSKHCVRATVSPMFHCPIFSDVFGFVADARGSADDIDACRVCRKTKREGGLS